MSSQILTGYTYLVLVVIIWVGSAVFLQLIFSGKKTQPFDKPFFITYLSTAFFVFYLLEMVICRKNGNKQKVQNSGGDEKKSLATLSQEAQPELRINLKKGEGQQMQSENQKDINQANQRTLKKKSKEMFNQTLKMSTMFCIFWFLANYLYNYGLSLTFATSSFILSNTSSIFVYIISLIIKIEKFNWKTFLGVIFGFGGVICVYFGEFKNQVQEQDKSVQSRIIGNIITLISALCYGIYSVSLDTSVQKFEKKFGKNSFKVSTFLGWVGLDNIVLFFGVFFIMHYTGLEKFEFPDGYVLFYLSLNAVIGTFISDYCWAQSVIKLGPLVTTLGLSVTIPIGMIVDSFYSDIKFGWLYYLGTVFVIIGFLIVTIRNHKERVEKEKNDLEKMRMD